MFDHLHTLEFDCLHVWPSSYTLEQSDSHIFTSIVHAFVCSRKDYCNSLLVGLPTVRLPPIQSVLSAAARLIAWFPRTSYISAFMFDHLHSSSLVFNSRFSHLFTARILVKLSGIYVTLSTCLPLPSLLMVEEGTWPSRSLCFASEDFYGSGTNLCNHWPFALEPTPSFDTIHFINWWAKCLFSFSLGLSHWKRFWLVCTARSAILCIDTIQYNTLKYDKSFS